MAWESNWATFPEYVDAAGRKRLDDCTGNGPRGRCKGTGRRCSRRIRGSTGCGAGTAHPARCNGPRVPIRGRPALAPGQIATGRGSAHPAALAGRGNGPALLTLRRQRAAGPMQGNGPRGPLARAGLHGAAGNGPALLPGQGTGRGGCAEGTGRGDSLTLPACTGRGNAGTAGTAHLGRTGGRKRNGQGSISLARNHPAGC